MISIWADGSSSGAGGGAGGYGWVIADGDQILNYGYGGTPQTTNNLMELEGCIQGLRAALAMGLNKPGVLLELVSDSQYALGMASGEYTPTKNFEQVTQLLELAKAAKVRCRWVRGHEGTDLNEACDALAKQGKIESMSPAQLATREAKRRKKTKA